MQIENFKNIIVTGPQRSGTRITSLMLADVLHKRYIDEIKINFDSLSKVFEFLNSKKDVVLQAPRLSSVIHLIDHPQTAVVFSIRKIEDIKKSEKRVNWKDDKQIKYYFVEKGEQSILKYDAWKIQKTIMKMPYFENKYGDKWMKDHRLWKEDRKKFGTIQTN